jgi:hypothetical protein
MTEFREIRDDLDPGTEDRLVRLAERLRDGRPVPSPAFRGDLRRHLLSRAPEMTAPARLRTLIAGYAGAGTLLMLLGALSAAGLGPLG